MNPCSVCKPVIDDLGSSPIKLSTKNFENSDKGLKLKKKLVAIKKIINTILASNSVI